MKESHGEGLVSHTDPESCVQHREVRGEALTGARAGKAIEPRNQASVARRILRGADALEVSGRLHAARRQDETGGDPARSKNQCMYGNLACGNREDPRESAAVAADRIGKSQDARR